jgi:hypothetical protein
MSSIIRFFFCLAVFFALPVLAMAKDHRTIKRPDFLLIQLSTEQNRMKLLESQGDEKGKKRLKKDLHSVYTAIRNDFRDHFSNCPVYFFFDTNIAQVKAKMLIGIVYTIEGREVRRSNLSGNNYQIAYFGYPVSHIPRIGYLPETADKRNFDTEFGRVWVVCDNDFDQVAYTEVPNYLERSTGYFHKKKYRYSSRKFDIEYMPVAYKLEQVFSEMAPR